MSSERGQRPPAQVIDLSERRTARGIDTKQCSPDNDFRLHAGQIDQQFAEYSINPPYPEMQQQFNEQMNSWLVRTDDIEGVFGVSVKGTEIPLPGILQTYRDTAFRQEVDHQNAQHQTTDTYTSALAKHYDITDDAAEAAAHYYYRHQEAFDAYFTVEQARNTVDTLLDFAYERDMQSENGNIVSFEEARERKGLSTSTTFASTIEKQFMQSVQSPVEEEKVLYDELVANYLTQGRRDLGIFGVTIRGTTLDIISVIEVYLNGENRYVVDTYNERTNNYDTYAQATADILDLDLIQVDAALCYYYQHELVFEVFRATNEATKRVDPRIDNPLLMTFDEE